MRKTIAVNTLSELPQAAKEFLKTFPEPAVFAFYGKMAAGKTTFIKELCKELGTEDPTSSPTYSLVNEYRGKNNLCIFHFDFYRIKKESEAFDMGFEGYLSKGVWCFIEWPEKISSLLPENCVKVIIEADGERRSISCGS